jgi:Arc/MetJ-type ribon-helix-helix transcriptional regulator
MSMGITPGATFVTPENELFIQQQLAAGAFHDRSEVVNTALALLRKRQLLIAHLRESERQYERGEYTEYDGEELRTLFDELKRRVRARVKAKQAEG